MGRAPVEPLNHSPWRQKYRPISKEKKLMLDKARRAAREDEAAMNRWASRGFQAG